jgi:hypothetical protein
MSARAIARALPHPRPIFWWALLIGSLAASVILRPAIDAMHPQGPPGGEVLYFASGSLLKRLSLGYEGLLADIYWTRVVQYYGRKRIAGARTYELLGPLLRVCTELDPRLVAAYRFGAIFLAEKPPQGAGQPQAAIALLQRGIVANPGVWRLWQDLGFIYYWDLHDYASAARVFKAGSERPGAPLWMKSLAATVAAKGGDSTTSRVLWSEIYRHADNESIRRSAIEHLQAIKAEEDLKELNRLLTAYRLRTGQPARSWGDLVAAGLLRAQPIDPSGVPYGINAAGVAVLGAKSAVKLNLIQ